MYKERSDQFAVTCEFLLSSTMSSNHAVSPVTDLKVPNQRCMHLKELKSVVHCSAVIPFDICFYVITAYF